MKTKSKYIKPQVELIMLRDKLMVIGGSGLDVEPHNPSENENDDPNDVKRYNPFGTQQEDFWGGDKI